VLANYPTRNSRLANGVGLDTPASTALMLQWLAGAGYKLQGPLPVDGEALIQMLLAGRSNDPESEHRPALTLLPLATYQAWYACLPSEGRQRLEAVWGPPELDVALVSAAGAAAGFPIRGLQLGHVSVLIQPDRGYDRDPTLSYHSPDLPPTHAYLAQYLWLRQEFGAHAVVHVGKHGNLEWLPGKGLGLSASCFPEWALGPLPHLYPFIVNDPGEGSQAKRRSQAVILDHLTPPLGRAGLHGELQRLEVLLDEYWEACQLGSERAGPLATSASSRRPRSDWGSTPSAPCRSPIGWRSCCSALPAVLWQRNPASPRPWRKTCSSASTPGAMKTARPWASQTSNGSRPPLEESYRAWWEMGLRCWKRKH
jgi:cobaltochelatase CobN